MKRRVRHAAQEYIVQGIVSAASLAAESDDEETAEAIREIGASIARRFGLSQVPGLPSTWK